MRLSRPLTVTSATVAVLVGATLPAGAHPFFTEGATVPASSLATLTLAMAHGCGTEDDAGGDPTIEISMEVPEQVSFLAPADVDGYEASTEGDEGAVPDVVTWTATDGGVPAPEVSMDVVVDGTAGDEIHVRVFQGCDGFAYRWVGTPDDPADDPAVLLTLTEPDPDAPPPPEPTEAEVTPEGEDPDAAIADEPSDGDAGDGDASDEDADEDGGDATAIEDLPTEPPAEAEADDGGIGWLPVVLGAVVLAGLGGWLAARRRPVGDPAAGDGTGMSPPEGR